MVARVQPDWRGRSAGNPDMGFWRGRLGAAWRTALACVLVWAATREGERRRIIVFPIFAYVMAVTVVGESRLGKAMEDSVAIATGTFQGVGFPLLLLHIFPSPSLSASIAAISASSFLAAYPSSLHILHKRIALAHSAIIFISAAVLRHRLHPLLFPLRLAATTLLGATCGTLALLLPIPHLALLQVSAQAKLSSRITAERLRVLVDAFTASHPNHASALCVQAKSLAEMGSTAHSELSSSQSNMGWEARRFPWRSADNLQRVTKGLTSLRKTLVGLELAMRAHLDSYQMQHDAAMAMANINGQSRSLELHSHGHGQMIELQKKSKSKSKQQLHAIMKPCLVHLADWVSLALGHASLTVRHRPTPSTRTHRQIILDEGHEVLSSFDEHLTTSLRKLSYTRFPSSSPSAFYASAVGADNIPVDSYLPEALTCNSDAEFSQYGDGADCPVFYNDDDHDCSLHLRNEAVRRTLRCRQDDAVDGSLDTAGLSFPFSNSDRVALMYDHTRRRLAYRIESADIDPDSSDPVLGQVCLLDDGARGGEYDIVARTPNDLIGNHHLMNFEAQATAFFFLFNIKMFVDGTKSMLSTLDAGAQLGSSATNRRSLRQLQNSHFPHSTPDIEAGNMPTMAAGNHRASRKTCRKCGGVAAGGGNGSNSSRPTTAAIGGAVGRKLLSYLSFKPEPTQLLAAFKVAMAMAIGAILGYWFNHRKGYWADITLALGYTGPAKGGSFRVAILRSLGTASGSIYGLLVVMATTRLPVLRLLALIPWVVFTSCLRQSRIFGYAGAVSALTGAIVILARTNKDSSDQEFTVIRIVEAFLGMASFIIVEMLVFPKRAAAMVKPDIINGLGQLQELVSGVFQAMYMPTPSDIDCDACSGRSMGLVTAELKTKEESLRRLISRQNALIKEATEEPQLWFAPFPAKIFSRLLEEEGKVVEMLHFAVAALEEIHEVAKETKIQTRKLVREPLGEAMKIMEGKVVRTLQILRKVMEWKEEVKMENSTEEEDEEEEAEGLMMMRRKRRRGYGGETGEVVERRFMEAFEKGVREVEAELLLGVAAADEEEEQVDIGGGEEGMANTVKLALGSMAFALNELLRHTTQLEKVVHELLQEENPWDLIHLFWSDT